MNTSTGNGMDMDCTPARVNVGRLVLGTALLAWGLVLTLDRTGLVDVRHAGALWPALIIALGVGKIAGSDNRRARRSGVWLLMIGLWFGFTEYTVFGYHDTWPLLVAAVGVMMVWDVLARHAAPHRKLEVGHDR